MCLCKLFSAAEKINEDSFNCMDEVTIEKVIPKTVPRASFLKHCKPDNGSQVPDLSHVIFLSNNLKTSVLFIVWSLFEKLFEKKNIL